MNQTHHINLLDTYWEAVKSGHKRFEVRQNDRGYQDGDYVVLHRLADKPGGVAWTYYYLCNGQYVRDMDDSDKMLFTISYVLPLSALGIDSDFVVFGLKEESE